MSGGTGEPLRIVVTGAGAPGIRGTVFSLRQNPERCPVHLIGVDMNANSVGKHFVDEFSVVPAPEDPGYADALRNLVRRTGADLVLPQTTREVVALSRLADRLAADGIRVAVTRAPKTEVADSKWELLQACHSSGFPAPQAVLTTSEDTFLNAIRDLGHPAVPVVAKLPHSNGMRGLRVIAEDTWDVARFIREKPSGTETGVAEFVAMLRRGGNWPELLVSEYLPGPEYTVDVFGGEAGYTAVVRLRRVIRSGITFEAVVIPDSELGPLSCDLGERMGLRYAFGFQWKEDVNGRPKILECNPRVQGTMVASTLAGVNIIWLAVREALGRGPGREELTSAVPRPITFSRFWGGGAWCDDRFVEI